MDRRKTWNRTARRTVLWWAGTFLALQIGLDFSLDTWLGCWRDPHYTARHELLCRQVEQHPQRPVVVVVGTSRTLYGLCPSSLPAGSAALKGPMLVNWGFPGHTPVHLALRLDRLIREGPKPDALVIEVVPAFLGEPWTDHGPIPAHALRWDDLPTACRLVPSGDLASAWRDAHLMPWFAYRHNVLSWGAPAWLPAWQRDDVLWRRLDEWGWFRSFQTTSSPEARRGVAKSFGPRLQRPDVHPAQARGLRHVLATCRGEKIPLAVLLMPEGPEYRLCYAPGTRKAQDAFLRSLCSELGATLVDARDWFDTEDAFGDGHHLVPEGAKRFTARFAAEVVPRLLGPTSPAATHEGVAAARAE